MPTDTGPLRIYDLDAKTTPGAGDLFEIVDVSDTSDAKASDAQGSSKQVTFANLAGAIVGPDFSFVSTGHYAVGPGSAPDTFPAYGAPVPGFGLCVFSASQTYTTQNAVYLEAISGEVTPNPASTLDTSGTTYIGIEGSVVTPATNSNAHGMAMVGVWSEVEHYGSGLASYLYGRYSVVVNQGSGGATNVIGDYVVASNHGSGTVTNVYGQFIDSPDVAAGAGPGVTTNLYGQYVAPQSGTVGAVNVWNLYIDGANDVSAIIGRLGVGTATPGASAHLEVDSTTRGFLPPRMTTTQKNAVSSPAEGLVVYDTTLHALCVYNGSAWKTVTVT